MTQTGPATTEARMHTHLWEARRYARALIEIHNTARAIVRLPSGEYYGGVEQDELETFKLAGAEFIEYQHVSDPDAVPEAS